MSSYTAIFSSLILMFHGLQPATNNISILEDSVPHSTKMNEIIHPKNGQRQLKYSIQYTNKPELLLKIKLSFIGDKSGQTELKIPHSWAWQNDFELGIRNVHSTNNDVKLNLIDSSQTIKLIHKPLEQIELSYEVFQYWDEPINREVYYRPILTNSYFHFIGHGVFIVPLWDKNVNRQIHIEWLGIADNWVIANSFDVRENYQLVNASISQLCHAPYMAGDFTISDINIKGYPLYVVQRGKWKFQPDEFNNMVKEVVNSVRDFWNDYEFPFFLVALIPTDNVMSKGGTGLTNSFEVFVSLDYPNPDDLKFLLTHEIFHTWNGRKIKRKEPEELVYWFSEGFTNYYARLILLRNNQITLDEFISDYNETIIDYYSSPVINTTNKDIKLLTHTNNQIEKLPYLRGDLIAFRLNRLIKESSEHSLDNVMYDLLD